ncbi:Galactose/lactose metabolism regulatory protein GAL80 [Lachnellula suecica]|uniref:Galactose/lactose metabolism regulatory protein GAL80 n=1 Tax=Lachnellula suecica TaxID=602035 RepID=A0A8T9CI31_9HELO|nr:Galactose/lactose metabolism regulatory protein GAL80 [Lachnellula suecica]
MALIKIGFIGLSATAGWARGAHLPFLKDSSDYEIVAVCNSSVKSSEAAIKLYSLSPSTKAYGDPEGVAKDPNVDLVVCSVRVDRHLATISSSLKAGKNFYVEWPLGKSVAEARELLKLKKENNVKTAIVGLQARQSPLVNKLKSLIESGAIGKVLNSTLSAQASNGGKTAPKEIKYFGDKEVGGNIVTIHFGHTIDYFQYVLGYGFQSSNGLLENRRQKIDLVDGEGKVVERGVPKTSDDTIFVQGTLSSGIPFSLNLRGGAPFKGTPGLDWRIYGETGEIRVTASGPFLQVGYPDMKIELHNFAKDTAEEIEVARDELDIEAPEAAFGGYAARNVGRVYRGLAKGEINCSFEDAVERHEFLEELCKQNGYVEA